MARGLVESSLMDMLHYTPADPFSGDISRTAVLSDCGEHRFSLTRQWVEEAMHIAVLLMLNPAKADHQIDDMTVGRCIKFCQAWGYDGLKVVNLYPFRSSKPTDLWEWLSVLTAADMAILQQNLDYIEAASKGASLRLVAFGSEVLKRQPPAYMQAITSFCKFGPVHCLGLSPSGGPLHPMARGKHRVPDSATPQPYQISLPS